MADAPPPVSADTGPAFTHVSPPTDLVAVMSPDPWAPVNPTPVVQTVVHVPEHDLGATDIIGPPEDVAPENADPAAGGATEVDTSPVETGQQEPDAPAPLGRRQRREQSPKLTRKDLRSQRLAKRRWWRPIVDVLVVIVCAAVVAVLIKAVAFRTFDVPSESMNPTLITNDRILVEMVTPHFDAYKRGDIVVFRDAGDWLDDGPDDGNLNPLQLLGIVPESTGYIVKRVLAVPGETIEGLADGTLLVNGEELPDPYSRPTEQRPFTWTLSEGEYWMMGDNRAGSADSRMHGPVNGSDFVGRVAFTFFPFDRAGAVD